MNRIESLQNAITKFATQEDSLYHFYEQVLHDDMGRSEKLEKLILEKKNSQIAFLYAKNIIKGRWCEAEPLIASSKDYAFDYAKEVVKSRWLEAEHQIVNHGYKAFLYARDIIQGRWTELERLIIVKNDFFGGINYARNIMNSRWTDLEFSIIQRRSHIAMTEYADNVIKGRWKEAEDAMIADTFLFDKIVVSYMCHYAITLKFRWKELEAVIEKYALRDDAYMQDNMWRYYINYVQQPWVEIEKLIASNGYYSLIYAQNILKDRFLLGEQSIFNIGSCRSEYCKFLKSLLEDE